MTAAGRTVLPNVHVPARGHVRALTGLRAVAVLWVVAFTFRGTGGSGWSAFYEPLRPLVDNGWLGVDLLFVLGGFVLTSDHLQDMGRRPRLSTVIAFYRDRLARVWPLYAVVVLGFAAWLVVKHVLGGGAHVHEPIQPKLDLPHLVEQLLMAQIWHRPYQDGGMIVLPTWALSAAGLAVVVFPLLVLLAWRLRTWPPLVTGAGAV